MDPKLVVANQNAYNMIQGVGMSNYAGIFDTKKLPTNVAATEPRLVRGKTALYAETCATIAAQYPLDW